MSRWSKRSSDEKHRILKEQEQLRRKKTVTGLVKGDTDTALAIYSTRQIPIMCPKCKDWRASEQYRIKHGIGILRGVNLIGGTCKDCGTPTYRAIPSAFDVEGIIFNTVLLKLIKDGRVRDLTKR